jgi:hypothetical protein
MATSGQDDYEATFSILRAKYSGKSGRMKTFLRWRPGQPFGPFTDCEDSMAWREWPFDRKQLCINGTAETSLLDSTKWCLVHWLLVESVHV